MTGPIPAVVDAAIRIKATSFLIDGEVVIARDDGTPDFHALRASSGAMMPATALSRSISLPRLCAIDATRAEYDRFGGVGIFMAGQFHLPATMCPIAHRPAI